MFPITLINIYMIYSVDIFELIQTQLTSLLAISFLDKSLYIYVFFNNLKQNIHLKYFINFCQSSRLFPLSYYTKGHD